MSWPPSLLLLIIIIIIIIYHHHHHHHDNHHHHPAGTGGMASLPAILDLGASRTVINNAAARLLAATALAQGRPPPQVQGGAIDVSQRASVCRCVVVCRFVFVVWLSPEKGFAENGGVQVVEVDGRFTVGTVVVPPIAVRGAGTAGGAPVVLGAGGAGIEVVVGDLPIFDKIGWSRGGIGLDGCVMGFCPASQGSLLMCAGSSAGTALTACVVCAGAGAGDGPAMILGLDLVLDSLRRFVLDFEAEAIFLLRK
jgi:hypothetical protein